MFQRTQTTPLFINHWSVFQKFSGCQSVILRLIALVSASPGNSRKAASKLLPDLLIKKQGCPQSVLRSPSGGIERHSEVGEPPADVVSPHEILTRPGKSHLKQSVCKM